LTETRTAISQLSSP